MSKRNRSTPRIPAPAPKPGEQTVETKDASELTKSALALLQESFNSKAEAIAAQAALAEGIDVKGGWKLDLKGVWFRPKPSEKQTKP